MADDALIEVKLSNNQVMLARVQRLDPIPVDGGGPRDVGLADQLASFSDITDVLRGVGSSILDALETIAPSNASVEFGLELALKGGKLVSVFVDAGGSASLRVNLSWERSKQANDGR